MDPGRIAHHSVGPIWMIALPTLSEVIGLGGRSCLYQLDEEYCVDVCKKGLANMSEAGVLEKGNEAARQNSRRPGGFSVFPKSWSAPYPAASEVIPR